MRYNSPLEKRRRIPNQNGSDGKGKKDQRFLTPFFTRETDLREALRGAIKFKVDKEFTELKHEAVDKKLPEAEKAWGHLWGLVHNHLEPVAFAELRDQDEILTMMKHVYIGKFRNDRKQLQWALYEPGSERHLQFSLSGLRGQTITKDYLKKLVKHLKFESVLTSVSLPSLVFEAQQNDEESQATQTTHTQQVTNATQKGKGRSDLVSIFRWLSENHVRTIKRVTVVDDGDRPHSDEAIEEALSGFGVEIWDWKKPDICSDVISTAAPNVQEVSLYWTGNMATILGWYSNEGFANRDKFKELTQKDFRLLR
ncbi:hypothetical protein B0T17DRAFT_270505 [Bombardia bombarda]|uniref:Uncharacterized protein n=1 Tax=Bombardia bombarda TaxID=252184 RepID=A0AA39X155_9PEZI|nr:hypothetical protein B0T17DRAFT_270505 [Bombardia bombarda]